MRTRGLHLCFSKGLWLASLLIVLSFGTKAQTTYYSKGTATDFNAPASWGTNTDGTGTSPASVTNADNYIVANNAALTLSSTASVRQLTVNSGSLSIGANTLTVAIAGANNSSLSVNGGSLTVSGGALNVNGNMLIANGSNFSQSGGNINVDGNNGGNPTGSVPGGTPIFAVGTSATEYGTGTISLTGGTMTIVDPTATSSTSDYAFWINLAANSNNITALAPHTLQFGNGSSVDTGGSTNGFYVYFWNGTGAYKTANMVVNTGSAAKRHVTMQYKAIFGGDLTISSGELRMPNTGPNNIAGNISVAAGAVLTNTATLVFGDGTYTSATAITNSPATNAQTVSGAGIFRDLTNSPKANFASITINNTSAGGVTFASAGSLLSGSNTGTVSGTLTFTIGNIHTGPGTFVLGADTNNAGSLSYTAGGFGSGSTFARWYKAAATGTSISASTVPSSSGSGSYPFATGSNVRHFYINRPSTTGATGGTISVSHTDGAGMNTIATVTDGAYNIDRHSAASWTVGTGNGFSAGTGTFTYAAAAQSVYTAFSTNGRLMQASSVPGTHQAGTNLPLVQRSAIPAASFAGTYYAGLSATELPIQSAQSGAWETPSTWVGGVVPACGQNVGIMSGHTVTVSAATGTANSGNIITNSGGTLVVSGGTLNVGCSNNNTTLTNNGTLTVSGGNVNINGNLAVSNGSAFSHSGGTITLDGNAAGVAANSVASGTPILAIGTSGTGFSTGSVSLTGGTIVITDPHTATTNTNGYAVYANMASGVFANAATAHSFQFGNGSSADAGGHTSGFYVSSFAGSGRLNFGNVTVNSAAGTNRNVVQTGTTVINGNLTLTAGTYDQGTGGTNIGGNIAATGGTFLTGGTVTFCTTTGTTTSQQTAAQSVSVSGSGAIQNLASSPTANFNTISIQNTSASGVVFNALNTPTGNANVAANVLASITFNGKASTPAGKALLWGTASAVGSGSLTVTSGGMVSGSTFARGHSAATTGSSISAGAVPTTTTSAYPFVDASGNQRMAWVSRATPTVAGIIGVTYTDAPGTSPVSITDGSYTVNQQYNGKWAVTALGTTPSAATYTLAISAVNAFGTTLAAANARITTLSGTVGTHQAGTTLPHAQRTGLTFAQLTGQDFYMGVNSSDVPFVSVATGAWETPATWNKGVTPGCTDAVVIANGHNVTVNAAAGNCAGLTINSGGTLTMAGNTLTVGCTNNNAPFINNGALAVNGGTLNVNGNILIANGSNFSQSGGNINVDGNNGGNPTGSVPGGTPIFAVGTSSTSYGTGTISLTGGTMTIVDPTATSSTSDYAFWINLAANSNNITALAPHTLQFGNGSSVDTGGSTNGFYVYFWNGTGAYKTANMVVNTGNAANRYVTMQYKAIFGGDLTISSGELRMPGSGPNNVAGNISVAAGAILTNTATLVLGDGTYTSSTTITNAPATNPQTISGAGTFRNLLASPTASLTGLTVLNSSSAGITLATPLSVSGTLTLTQGLVNTTSANLLTLGTTAAPGTLSGGGSTSYVKGPFGLIVPASRTAGTFLTLPVGKSGYNPAAIDPATTSGGPVTFLGEAFDGNTGTAGSGLLTLNAGRRWEIPVLNGSANLSTTQVRIGDAAIATGNGLGMASSAAGAYNAMTGTAFNSGTPNTLSTTTAIPVADYTGFFGFGTTGPLTLGTIAAVQQTGTVSAGTTDNNILRIDIPNSGSVGSITLTGLTVTYTGTAASDIAASGVTLWTGTATAPATQIGTSQSLSGGSATFSGLSVNSVIGSTTYLWVRLNTSATAVIGNNTDLRIDAGGMTFSSAGGATAPGTQPVSALDPAGNRPIDYCQASTDCTDGDVITNVTVSTINNNSTCSANGYTSYVGVVPVANFYTSVATPFSATVGDGGTEYVGVWIDYDHNGAFDASEFTAIGSGNNVTISGSITVPPTALTGPTRMRVRVRFNTTLTGADPCLVYTYGETEDYAVNILASVACSGTPYTPVIGSNVSAACPGATVNLNITNVPGNVTGLSYVWESSAAGAGTWSTMSATGTTASVTFSAATDYRVTVTCANGSGTATSAIFTLGQNPFYACYCQTNLGGGGTSIDTVQILTTTLNNATPGNAANNYTAYPASGSTTASLQKGSTYTLHAAYGGSAIGSVWIDYNHSGTFEASEWAQINTSGTSGNASITIPVTALTGTTGMRVRSRATANPNGSGDPCTNFGSGETEDYMVNIICVNPVVTLGNDTALCTGGTLSLNAGNSGATYSWSTGATTQSISITATGTYSVAVTNTGCTGRDTVVVTAGTLPAASLGNDTTICPGASLVLNGGTAGAYSWSTGATTQTISVTAAGSYSVALTNTGAGCKKSDTIAITISPIPTFSLGNDTALCTGGSLSLNIPLTGTYLWSTGATTQSITAAATGTYWARIQNAAGCSHTDTLVVTAGVLPVASLGNDTAICSGNSVTLNGGTATSYLWNSGATTQTVTASAAGNYSVTLSNPGAGCSDADTLALTVNPLPVAGTITVTNTSPTFGFSAAGAQNATGYSWDFGDSSPAGSGQNVNHTYTANGTYTITLTVTNDCGSATTTTIVTVGGVSVGTVTVHADDLKLYPNPAAGIVYIDNVSALNMQRITVTNAMGAVVMIKDKTDSRKESLDISSLSSGVYTVRISTDKGVVVRQLQVLH